MTDDLLILGGLLSKLARLRETRFEILAAVFGYLEAFVEVLLVEVERENVARSVLQEGFDPFVVGMVTEDEGVDAIVEVLVANPAEEAERVGRFLQVVTEDEEGWGLVSQEGKGLVGAVGALDLKASFP